MSVRKRGGKLNVIPFGRETEKKMANKIRERRDIERNTRNPNASFREKSMEIIDDICLRRGGRG